jgi:hypothetical protein
VRHPARLWVAALRQRTATFQPPTFLGSLPEMRHAAALVICLTFGCGAPPQAGSGGKCHALRDCKRGLACVERRCTRDLTPVEGRVPEYAEETPAAPPDAGAEAPGVDGG